MRSRPHRLNKQRMLSRTLGATDGDGVVAGAATLTMAEVDGVTVGGGELVAIKLSWHILVSWVGFWQVVVWLGMLLEVPW